MPDYEKMYKALFNQVSDVITMLEDIQQKTEEMYIEDSTSAEDDIT